MSSFLRPIDRQMETSRAAPKGWSQGGSPEIFLDSPAIRIAISQEYRNSKMLTLLLHYGAKINRYHLDRMIRGLKEICNPMIIVSQNRSSLRYRERLAQLFQFLLNRHFYLSPDRQDPEISALLADCLAWVISVTKSKPLHRLEDEDLLIAKMKSLRACYCNPTK